jgi:hypothetical protein
MYLFIHSVRIHRQEKDCGRDLGYC